MPVLRRQMQRRPPLLHRALIHILPKPLHHLQHLHVPLLRRNQERSPIPLISRREQTRTALKQCLRSPFAVVHSGNVERRPLLAVLDEQVDVWDCKQDLHDLGVALACGEVGCGPALFCECVDGVLAVLHVERDLLWDAERGSPVKRVAGGGAHHLLQVARGLGGFGCEGGLDGFLPFFGVHELRDAVLAFVEGFELAFPVVVFGDVLEPLEVAVQGDHELGGGEDDGFVEADKDGLQALFQFAHVCIVACCDSSPFLGFLVHDYVVCDSFGDFEHGFSLGHVDLVHLHTESASQTM